MNKLANQIIQGQEQVNMVFKAINDHIKKLYDFQAAIFGEFADISTLVFSLGLSGMIWLLTSFKRTESSRFTCLLIIAFNCLCER